MTLYQDLLAWEERLLSLLDEMRLLSARVAHLEQQHRQLQESHVKSSYDSGGLTALHDLYNEGFHICHAHFTETREDDCLFCLSLLHTNSREAPPEQEESP